MSSAPAGRRGSSTVPRTVSMFATFASADLRSIVARDERSMSLA